LNYAFALIRSSAQQNEFTSALLKRRATEFDSMVKLITSVVAILLLGACVQRPEPGQSGLSQAREPPTQFQSIGSCEPTAWDDNRGQCILVLQNAERVVRQEKGAS
jgi:hypothetical protein